jgi:hypothetical protein
MENVSYIFFSFEKHETNESYAYQLRLHFRRIVRIRHTETSVPPPLLPSFVDIRIVISKVKYKDRQIYSMTSSIYFLRSRGSW